MLQLVDVGCSAFQCVLVGCSDNLYVTQIRCRADDSHNVDVVLQCLAVRCSVLQCVAVYGSMLQCFAVRFSRSQ